MASNAANQAGLIAKQKALDPMSPARESEMPRISAQRNLILKQKALDPSSVMRESESARSAKFSRSPKGRR